MAKRFKILVLGGTAAGRQIAGALSEKANYEVIYSLAGVTQAPLLPDTKIRTGGFSGGQGDAGGDGLQSYVSENRIDAIVDATHPFATEISAKAAAVRSVPVLRLQPRPWVKSENDHWHCVRNLDAAVSFLAAQPPQRLFLALGSKHLPKLCARLQHRLVARLIEMPAFDQEGFGQAANLHIIRQRPPFDTENEIRLFKTRRIQMLVTRNTGTKTAWPKIEAARQLGLPVLMIRQPRFKYGPDSISGAISGTISGPVPCTQAQIPDQLSHMLES